MLINFSKSKINTNYVGPKKEVGGVILISDTNVGYDFKYGFDPVKT